MQRARPPQTRAARTTKRSTVAKDNRITRTIDEVILHCSATREGQDISTDTIRKWHVEGRGWSDIGYHFVIRLDGTLDVGRPLHRAGAHVKGRNKTTIGVCYIGGVERDGKTPKDTMNRGQEATFRNLMTTLRACFGDLSLHGHNEYSAKACPSFDVQEKFKDIL